MRLYCWWGGGKSGKIKCPCRKKHETIKMGENTRRGTKGMSCNWDRGEKRDCEREGEETEGKGG